MGEETQKYPIDSRCKDCSLFQVVEEMKKEIIALKAKVASLEKELEQYRKPPKDSSNSSIPSSQNRWTKKYPPRPKSTNKVGGQFGHIGYNKSYLEPTEIIKLNDNVCPHCGGIHFEEKISKLKRKQVIDLEITPVVKEYQQRHLICSNCKRKMPSQPFPIKGNVEYGENIKKTIGYLNIQHNCSYARLPQIFEDLFNIKISKGTIDNILKELANDLKNKYISIQKFIKNSSIIGSDETGMRINNKNCYLWTFQNTDATFFVGSKTRGYDVIEDVIGNDFKGTWVSDRYGGQLKMNCSHQLCSSHLIRDCNYAIESDNTHFPKRLKKLLKETIHFKNKYGEEYKPNTKEIFREKEKYKEQLSDIFKKKPNQTKEETRKLWNSLVYRQKELLLFLEDKDIPATNNASERALRNRVIKNKVSGCFRSELGAFCNDVLSSIIETAKKQKVSLMDALNPAHSFAF